MAGYFQIGEQKIRPGVYFNVQSKDKEVEPIDGIVVCLFRATTGPIGEVRILNTSNRDDYTKVFGTEGTTDVIREALAGGAIRIIACRLGTGGSKATTSLPAASGSLLITTKYPGTKPYTVTVRNKLTDPTLKQIVFYEGTTEIERHAFEAGGDEVAKCIDCCKYSTRFDLAPSAPTTDPVAPAGSGVITNVSQKALLGGADPTINNESYSDALLLAEKYYFNTVVIDNEDEDIQAIVYGWLDRIYEAGQFGIASFAPLMRNEMEDRETIISNINHENVAFVLNPDVTDDDDNRLRGYQVAARIGGLIAATPSNQSVTHTVFKDYASLNEKMTNTDIENAELKGCLVLDTNNNDEVMLDNGINTLVRPDENHDNGWKKLRRTKARYELMFRANNAADELVGKVNNDKVGRATIRDALQGVINDMVSESKLTSGTAAESALVTADGDTCGFSMDIVDKDSAEKIHIIYYYQWSTIESKGIA
jgi:hypothetical protein